jgi:hypothetical protein
MCMRTIFFHFYDRKKINNVWGEQKSVYQLYLDSKKQTFFLLSALKVIRLSLSLNRSLLFFLQKMFRVSKCRNNRRVVFVSTGLLFFFCFAITKYAFIMYRKRKKRR